MFSEPIQLASGVVVSSENFKLERPGKLELRAEIEFLNGMLYIWIGSGAMHSLNNLQIAYPGTVKYFNVSSRFLLFLYFFLF